MPYTDREKAREYHRKYHLKNWAKRKASHLRWKRKRRLQLALWLKNYKNNLNFIRCVENHPACLYFHHQDKNKKDASVSNMISQGFAINTIKMEIDKCIVLCRNCHAKEHYNILKLTRGEGE